MSLGTTFVCDFSKNWYICPFIIKSSWFILFDNEKYFPSINDISFRINYNTIMIRYIEDFKLEDFITRDFREISDFTYIPSYN
jgi:hypothetical protein